MTSSPNSTPSTSALARLLRLRTVLIVPFVLQVLLIVGLVGYLSFRSGQRAVYDLAMQLRHELTARIKGELRSYFDVPLNLVQINVAALSNGAVSFEPQGNVFLFQQEILRYSFLTAAYCSTEAGEHSTVKRELDDPLFTYNVLVNETTAPFRYKYKLDSQGKRTELLEKGDAVYDPRQRPWYQAVVQQGGPTWGDIYLDFTTKLPTLTASGPVYDNAGGKLIGACGVDLILSAQVRQFLANLTIGKSGRAFIMDRKGGVLASSGSEPLNIGTGQDTKMLLASDSSDPRVRETALFLANQPGGLAAIQQSLQVDFQLDGERQFVQVAPFQDRYGLDFLIVITVPERDFMEQINANTRTTILLCLAALLVALLVGVLTARWLTRPILRITDASEALAGGDLDQQVHPSPVVEVGRLGNAFNSMARQLKAAFANIQTSEKKFRSLYEDSKDAIFISQPDGALLDMNPAGLRLFGLTADQVTTTNTKQFYVHPEDQLKFREQMERQGSVSDFEVQLQNLDGAPFDALITATLRHDEVGRPIGFQGLIRDITVQKQNEQLKAENLRMGAELDVSRRLQQMILPTREELAAVSGLDIAAYMDPAAEVGGDYYDVLRENGAVKIGIGDVTDHGLESGVVMLMAQTAVRTLLTSGENDPARFLDVLNRTVYGNVQRMQTDRNLSLSLIDYEGGRVRLSGQHEELILVRKGGEVERVDTTNLGFPIGLYDEATDFFNHTTLDLAPGDGFVLYTDGVTEAENPAGEQYSLERLCQLVSRHWQQSAEQIKETVIEDVRHFIDSQRVFDDITLLVVKQR